MSPLMYILCEVAVDVGEPAEAASRSMPGLVYVLCAITSVASAFLLWRSARGSASRLLMWSSLCFVGMAVNNVLLFVSAVTPPTVDLEPAANASALLSVVVLLVGLIWDAT